MNRHRPRRHAAALHPRRSATALRACAGTALLGLSGSLAWAQSGDAGGAGAGAAGFADRSPYYIGASQGVTHDSNVYRVPFGPSDTYSSTSLFAGFDQPVGRQRLFGRATVTYNRYFDETPLNNTSYSLVTGVDWETVMRLSGSVTATYDRRLAAPGATAFGDGSTDEEKNTERRQGFSGLVRWGGDSIVTLESRLAHARLDYSNDNFTGSETRYDTVSLGVFYKPGASLRLGVAGRVESTRTPRAFLRADGGYEGNDARSRNIDLLADYNRGGNLSGAARLSYTRLRNSLFDDADFSGLTGSVNVGYQATGRLGFTASAARYTGYNGGFRSYGTTTVAAVPGGTGTGGAGSGSTNTGASTGTGTPAGTATSPALTSAYENNQLTYEASLGATYALTSKITLSAVGRYQRSRLVAAQSASTGEEATVGITDRSRGASLGATWAYSRAWTFACNLSRDRRTVSGDFGYGYTVDTAGCLAQFIWR